MAQTIEEVREDAEGRFYVWQIISSDVEGEGGAIRGSEVSMVGITTHELGVRQGIEALTAQLRQEKEKLDRALWIKGQIEARLAAIQPEP